MSLVWEMVRGAAAAAIVPCDRSTFHSDSLALSATGCGAGSAAAPTNETASSSPATLRDRIAWMLLIRDLPPPKVGQRFCSTPETGRTARLFRGNNPPAQGVSFRGVP